MNSGYKISKFRTCRFFTAEKIFSDALRFISDIFRNLILYFSKIEDRKSVV